MHHCQITGDRAEEVKRKTVEQFFIWLEEANKQGRKQTK
jgi:hypothetical protein